MVALITELSASPEHLLRLALKNANLPADFSALLGRKYMFSRDDDVTVGIIQGIGVSKRTTLQITGVNAFFRHSTVHWFEHEAGKNWIARNSVNGGYYGSFKLLGQ